jgi:hypothetical protein
MSRECDAVGHVLTAPQMKIARGAYSRDQVHVLLAESRLAA